MWCKIMQELIYLEIPTPDTSAVRTWLGDTFQPVAGKKIVTASGCVVEASGDRQPQQQDALEPAQPSPQLSIFVWTVQRTTYLKAFRWSETPLPQEQQILAQLEQQLRVQFPYDYPAPPDISADLAAGKTIFEALAAQYPLTVKYFQQFPNGEADLHRAYWWEQRWRESVQNPSEVKPKQVLFQHPVPNTEAPAVEPQPLPAQILETTYDLIYLGGALGVIHAAMMARLGYRVCLVERLPFGRMNREWNISRAEFQVLVDCGLLTNQELESLILCEYADGFNKFFDRNNPPQAKAPVLHTPTVLNIAVDSAKLLQICGEKLRAARGNIIDQTEFEYAVVDDDFVTIVVRDLSSEKQFGIKGKLLVDAMGSASAIAQQLNAGRAFDSVCPTVGAVVEGFEPGVWDFQYGDVLNSHGDISRGRQLIWELFPGKGKEMAIYLFHYHQVDPRNPGSLLEMYEDFFAILPEYRRCDLDKLIWKKATFGYIPGHFSLNASSRKVSSDRLIAIGDAAALQSPLVFTGFGSLVRNFPRLTSLLDVALRHNLLTADDLAKITAYQSNVAVTWLFSKGMMVPTGKYLPPERINAMLNTFFGVLTMVAPEVSDRFIKDRASWLEFNRLAVIAAAKNPALLLWILDMAGAKDMLRWLSSYFTFTRSAIANALFGRWLALTLPKVQAWLEPNYPKLWLRLLSWSYVFNYAASKVKS
jgi:lycopene cyclase CruA